MTPLVGYVRLLTAMRNYFKVLSALLVITIATPAASFAQSYEQCQGNPWCEGWMDLLAKAADFEKWSAKEKIEWEISLAKHQRDFAISQKKVNQEADSVFKRDPRPIYSTITAVILTGVGLYWKSAASITFAGMNLLSAGLLYPVPNREILEKRLDAQIERREAFIKSLEALDSSKKESGDQAVQLLEKYIQDESRYSQEDMVQDSKTKNIQLAVSTLVVTAFYLISLRALPASAKGPFTKVLQGLTIGGGALATALGSYYTHVFSERAKEADAEQAVPVETLTNSIPN